MFVVDFLEDGDAENVSASFLMVYLMGQEDFINVTDQCKSSDFLL